MRSSLLWLLSSTLLVVLGACSRPAADYPGPLTRKVPWSSSTIDQVADVPLQQNGRTKPVSTYASYLLYFVHGRRDVQFTSVAANGDRSRVTLSPTEWLCDVWCYPEQAAKYPLFRIENTQVLDALGIANEGQRQGFEYLSYEQVLSESVLEKLRGLAKEYGRVDQLRRNEVQEHVVQLWRQFVTYSELHDQLASLRYDLAVEDPKLRELLGADRVRVAQVLAKAAPVVEYLKGRGPDIEKPGNEPLARFYQHILRVIQHGEGGVRLVSPGVQAAESEEWHTLGEAIREVLAGESRAQQLVVALEDMARADSHEAREAALLRFASEAKRISEARSDVRHVALENTYYKKSWHYQSIHWYLLGFVLAAVCWLVPKNRLTWWASLGVTTIATCMLSWDVVLRCLITERPPIKNLYDTFLFIAAVGAIVAIVAEFVLPRRIALALAPFFGALFVMFGRLFEVSKGEDTMDPLVAVLDSNFWLATHVTSINIGYSAGLIAAFLGLGWIWMRVLRIKVPSDQVAKALVRQVYGVTAFSLSFSVVGTILGGVWANDSWGRFWGWDPKENGALMICLMQVAMLHARLSGMIRDFGQVVWATATGMVVVFSWFHTNLLGVGLHSYGFSAGLRDVVWIGYMVGGGSLLIGWIDVLLRPNPLPRSAPEVVVPMAADAR